MVRALFAVAGAMACKAKYPALRAGTPGRGVCHRVEAAPEPLRIERALLYGLIQNLNAIANPKRRLGRLVYGLILSVIKPHRHLVTAGVNIAGMIDGRDRSA